MKWEYCKTDYTRCIIKCQFSVFGKFIYWSRNIYMNSMQRHSPIDLCNIKLNRHYNINYSISVGEDNFNYDKFIIKQSQRTTRDS